MIFLNNNSHFENNELVHCLELKMGQLENMALFVRIVEAGGIGKAAEQLNIAKSAVSKRLSELENKLGIKLLSRTTRRSNLTDAGTTYYQRALTVLDDVSDMNAQTSGINTSLAGTLKMTMPLSFGLLHLTPIIDEFTKLHPNLLMQIDFVDRHVDLIEEGYELAIRIAELKDSSLQAKKITPIKLGFYASPTYLQKNQELKTLVQLRDHQFLHYGITSLSNTLAIDGAGKKHKLQLTPKLTANNGDFLKDMAINGQGVTILPSFIAYKAVANKTLQPILTSYQLPELYAYAVYPQNRFLSQRCRLLIDFIADKFGDTPYWDLA